MFIHRILTYQYQSLINILALDKLNHGLSQKSIKDMLIVLKMVVRFGEQQGWLNHVEWKVKFPARLSQERIATILTSY